PRQRRQLVRRRRPRRRQARHPRLSPPHPLPPGLRPRRRPRHPPARPPPAPEKERRMTDGPRQTHRLVTEILTVLERHGHHAHDAQRTDQAVTMIADLAGIYDGTSDVPASTGRHAAPGPYPE